MDVSRSRSENIRPVTQPHRKDPFQEDRLDQGQGSKLPARTKYRPLRVRWRGMLTNFISDYAINSESQFSCIINVQNSAGYNTASFVLWINLLNTSECPLRPVQMYVLAQLEWILKAESYLVLPGVNVCLFTFYLCGDLWIFHFSSILLQGRMWWRFGGHHLLPAGCDINGCPVVRDK